jgi:hypothetical protein
MTTTTIPVQEEEWPVCSFGWRKLQEMKEEGTEFWAADGLTPLRIIEVDEKAGSVHMMCRKSGKITWPLKYQKLEEVHRKIHRGEISLNSYEIERLLPTWGNYATGLLKHLGCDRL